MLKAVLSMRSFAAAVAIASAVAIATPTPAKAGIGTGAAIGLGLGALALGTAIGSGAFAQPYYYPHGYYAPAPTYYAPVAPVPQRSCWYPQYGGYYAC